MKILSISARLDDAVRTRIGNVSIDGVEGRLKTVSRCNVLVIWNRNSDDTESESKDSQTGTPDHLIPMSEYALSRPVGDLTDAVWESVECGQAEIHESNLSHASFEFIVDGKDLSNDYDFSEIDFKYGDDAESQYEGDGEEWYGISAVLSDGNEVEHDDGDSLDDWLREEGYLTDE